MSAARVQTVAVYECAGCGEKVIAASTFREDAPEGYYLTVRRVTERQNHTITDEMYTCSKNCALQFVQYGIGNTAYPTTPIGKKKR